VVEIVVVVGFDSDVVDTDLEGKPWRKEEEEGENRSLSRENVNGEEDNEQVSSFNFHTYPSFYLFSLYLFTKL
jgi:hypothetical protein